MSEIAIITTFYNPCKYQRLLDNYHTFRNHLGYDLYTAEISYDGSFGISDSMQIVGTENNMLWQKERLLNLIIDDLPLQYKYVAWVDADLIFQNRDWLEETLFKLKKHPVVQLLEKIDYLDPDGHLIETKNGWAATQNIRSKYRFPGGCWAARREVLDRGMYDCNVVGGGDAMLLSAWSGDWIKWLMKRVNKAWRHHYLQWSVDAYRQVKGNIGFTSGKATHLWHGCKKKRNYVNRWLYLTDHAFDPDVDIAIDDNGLWRWNSDKPEMHEAVAGYFAERDEDNEDFEL